MPALTFLCLMAVAVDGDTLRCADLPAGLDGANGRVRLARIDAPERGEPGHEAATRAMAAMIDGRDVRCTLVDADPRIPGFQPRGRFGRPVARCRANGRDLGQAMITAKLAVKWPRK